jgi:RDD family protein
MLWREGRVDVEDSVAMSRPVTGSDLRDGFLKDIASLTLGLVRARDNSLYLGPVELLRFGRARVTRTSVEWPIEGGLFARGPGGRLRIEALRGRLAASVEGYRPFLPLALYVVSQLPVHHLVTRLHLLRVRGRQPAPGVPAEPTKRIAAAAIDLGLCAALAASSGRRRRLPALLGIATAYHVACWSISGRTLGGMLMGQRLVSVDGSRPTLGQALVRLAALPISALRLRAIHDEVAGTDVVASPPSPKGGVVRGGG